jgi:hypothetical protein
MNTFTKSPFLADCIARMKLSILLLLLVPFQGNAQNTWQWGSIGGSNVSIVPVGNHIDEWIRSMATDQKGNTYAVVMGADKIHVDDSASHFNGYYAHSIVSWTCDGRVRWIKTIKNSTPGRIATDSLGGVYFTGRMLLNGSSGSFDNDTTLAPTSGYTWNYIAKYDTAGHFKWVKFPDVNLQIANFMNWPQYIHLQAAPNGALSVLAYLPPGAHAGGTYTVTDSAYHVLNFDSNGQFTGGIPLPMKPVFDINGVPMLSVVEASHFLKDNVYGNYYLAGSNTGPSSYYTLIIGNDTLRSNNPVSMYAAAFGSNGKLKWLKQQAPGSWASVDAAALNKSGSLYLSGQATNGNTWNGSTFSVPAGISLLAYALCMDSSGNNKWISSGYNPQNKTPRASCIAVGSTGTVAVSGEVFNSWKWGTYSLHQLPPAGQTNDRTGMYVAFLNPLTGAITGMDSVRVTYGYGNRMMPQYIQADTKGNFYLSGGIYNPSAMPNTLTIVGNDTLKAFGGDTDFFMLKYGQNNCNTPTAITERITNDKRLVCYPNPATNTVNLVFPENYKKALCTITDMQGRIIQTANVSSSDPRIDVSNLAPGNYILNVLVAHNESFHTTFSVYPK